MPTVLYAEDDVEHRTMMRVIMRNTDITLVEASDGQEALQKIQHQCPDLILLDLFMPKLDGHGVMEALKSDPETRHIPIIVLSAWSTGDNRNRAKNAGALDFIAKPYDPLELVRIVKHYLPGKADASQASFAYG
ncbi:MAG: response regulator [Dehalococcoidia bacterium]|nr:MAG: response regulator [Dehalococcoidia bacterium]